MKINEEAREIKDYIKIGGIMLLVVFPVLISVQYFASSTTIPEIKQMANKKVYAFYYNWYGNTTVYEGELAHIANQWIGWNSVDYNPPNSWASNYTPVLGLYDSGEKSTILHHVKIAKEAGIDGFICTWWGKGSQTDYKFNYILSIMPENYPTFEWAAYFEPVQDRFRGNVSLVAQEIKYIVDSYGTHPNYIKIGENKRPVIFVYNIPYLGVNFWVQVRQHLKNMNVDPFLVGDLDVMGEPTPEFLSTFEGVHKYLIIDSVFNRDYDAFHRMVIPKVKQAGRLACYTVSPGFNNYAITNQTGYYVDREGGKLYESIWKSAIANNPDWILITSFNEWYEGTQIEPSVEFGTQYLQLTAEYTAKWKN